MLLVGSAVFDLFGDTVFMNPRQLRQVRWMVTTTKSPFTLGSLWLGAVYQSGHPPLSGKFGGLPTVYCRMREIRGVAVAALGSIGEGKNLGKRRVPSLGRHSNSTGLARLSQVGR